MLILTRRPGDSIIIELNEEVKVMVCSINGLQVRIGVKADKKVNIFREELVRRK